MSRNRKNYIQKVYNIQTMFHWLKRLWQRLFGDVQDEPGDSSDASQKEASGESKFKVIECEILDIEDEDDIIDYEV